MLRIITLNLNGIRSAVKKGLFNWLAKQAADIICVQELKAQLEDLDCSPLQLPGYEGYFHCALKKGYSGVGIYTKIHPLSVRTGLDWSSVNDEGRYIELDFGKLCVASLYMPSGSSGDERQAVKFDFLARYATHLKALRKAGREYIICGDWNIAHRQIDLKNWRANQKHSGFLPEERTWMDQVINDIGFVDAFRLLNQTTDQYTWWSNRGQAWAKNVGWRIDYQMVTPGLAEAVQAVAIYKDERFSDHAPLTVDYQLTLSLS